MNDENLHKMVVWGVESGRCMRVYWMAEELGLDYQIVPITSRSGETLTEDFSTLNPIQKIPVLKYGDTVISESAAILMYMADKFALPEGFCGGKTPDKKAVINQWCFFVMTELDAHSLYLIRRHDSLREVYGEAPEAVVSAEKYFNKQINAAAEKMTSNGPYIMGSSFSIADILLTSCLDWAVAYRLSIPAKMEAYRALAHERQGYQKALKITYPNGMPTSMLRTSK